MTKLDETGLEAAHKRAHELGLDALADPWAPYLGSIITAYLAATHTSDALRDLQRLGQECEGDRIAVVVNAEGAVAAMVNCGVMAEENWREMEEALERSLGATGPFRRQIVRCNLLRPEPVGEISGTTEPA